MKPRIPPSFLFALSYSQFPHFASPDSSSAFPSSFSSQIAVTSLSPDNPLNIVFGEPSS